MKGKSDQSGARVAGAMSGTSLDGVDIAVIETDGVDVFDFGPNFFRAFSPEEKAVLRASLGKWPGEAGVAEAAELVLQAHTEAMAGVTDVALLGFHGQTLAHAPEQGRTHQAGDGAGLAEACGVPVVWDFRSSDMALGGQGAPLAPFYHWALARHVGAAGPVAFLNLGGVGNITWVDPRAPAPDAPGALLAFDTGPANAPLDDLMRARGLGEVDVDGALGLTGTPDMAGLAEFLRDGYFLKIPPKSLDRNDFAYLVPAVAGLSPADALASLAAMVAGAVLAGFQHLPAPPKELWVTGGGRKNACVMRALADALPCEVMPVEDKGLDGDALEAQAFAYLALRVAKGMTTSAPSTTGVAAAMGGGQISGDVTL